MQTELVAVLENATILDALESVRAAAKDVDILSVFVVDDKKRYRGNVALQDLIFADPTCLVEDVMDDQLVDVTTKMDQEEVARTFDHYGLVEIGVTDAQDVYEGASQPMTSTMFWSRKGRRHDVDGRYHQSQNSFIRTTC